MTFYQIFVGQPGEWTLLVYRPFQLPDGRFLSTKVLPSGDLQYIRRTGEIGILPAADKWTGGEPRFKQWREHPELNRPTTAYRRADEPRPAPPPLPEGLVFDTVE